MAPPYTLKNNARVAARLDHALGRLIRRSERVWQSLSMLRKRQYVETYRALRNALAKVSGKYPPEITSPWTREEFASSLTETWGGYCSMVGALEVDQTPLPTAVRVTERVLAKSDRLPKTLNSAWRPVKGLARIGHAYTVAEVEEIRVRPRPATPSTPRHTKDDERAWLAKAEAKYARG